MSSGEFCKIFKTPYFGTIGTLIVSFNKEKTRPWNAKLTFEINEKLVSIKSWTCIANLLHIHDRNNEKHKYNSIKIFWS